MSKVWRKVKLNNANQPTITDLQVVYVHDYSVFDRDISQPCVSVVLLVAWLARDLNHLSSNLAVVMSEWCFIFDFASLPLDVAQSILAVQKLPSNIWASSPERNETIELKDGKLNA